MLQNTTVQCSRHNTGPSACSTVVYMNVNFNEHISYKSLYERSAGEANVKHKGIYPATKFK